MKKTEEKKTAVKAAAKTTAAKPAAKTAAKVSKPEPTAKKTAAKSTTKSAAKTVAASTKTAAKTAKAAPAAKKPGRKPKPVTIDTICGLAEKKIIKSKVSAIKETIAVDIEVWGFEDGSNHKMYIEVKDGKATVMPHSYDAKNFRVSLSFANAMDFVNGKSTLANLLYDKDFYAEGNIADAVKLAKIFG